MNQKKRPRIPKHYRHPAPPPTLPRLSSRRAKPCRPPRCRCSHTLSTPRRTVRCHVPPTHSKPSLSAPSPSIHNESNLPSPFFTSPQPANVTTNVRVPSAPPRQHPSSALVRDLHHLPPRPPRTGRTLLPRTQTPPRHRATTCRKIPTRRLSRLPVHPLPLKPRLRTTRHLHQIPRPLRQRTHCPKPPRIAHARVRRTPPLNLLRRVAGRPRRHPQRLMDRHRRHALRARPAQPPHVRCRPAARSLLRD